MRFVTSRSDPSLFFRLQNQSVIILLVYVDDIIITGNSENEIQHIIHEFQKIFSIKDLGKLTHFLGIEVSYGYQGIVLNQEQYVSEILGNLKMQEAKGVSSQIVSHPLLSKFDGQPMDNPKLYRSVVGALQHNTITRPEIAYSDNKLSQYMQTPLHTRWKALKRVLRYLAGTLNYGLHIKAGPLHLGGFADVD
ncbi:Uncharacterized mitochondrial protein AtMg00810 [Striga hermonthica]|uniref:Uncharacterized mitochondrial protein AtMg00810 n=1 Tax=Striga hermonthica TaxID=68872 RepID=A0A9N7N337_STRHE|nr:Uncharacterized mitochondrial protein AtMg00810 [Striga hermonthica]